MKAIADPDGLLTAGLAAIRAQFSVPDDFPPEVLAGKMRGRGFIGQKQKWFAFRFTGYETEIDLEQHAEIEFDAWRWGRLDEAPDLIVPFKRDAYLQIVAAFKDVPAGIRG